MIPYYENTMMEWLFDNIYKELPYEELDIGLKELDPDHRADTKEQSYLYSRRADYEYKAEKLRRSLHRSFRLTR